MSTLCSYQESVIFVPTTRKIVLDKLRECNYEGITVEIVGRGDGSIEDSKYVECNDIKYYYRGLCSDYHKELCSDYHKELCSDYHSQKRTKHFSYSLKIKLVKFCYCEAINNTEYCENHSLKK